MNIIKFFIIFQLLANLENIFNNFNNRCPNELFRFNYFGSFDLYKSFNETEYTFSNLNIDPSEIKNVCETDCPNNCCLSNNCKKIYNKNGDKIGPNEIIGVSYGGIYNSNISIDNLVLNIYNLNDNLEVSNILYYVNIKKNYINEIKIYNNLPKRFFHSSVILEELDKRKLYILNGKSDNCNKNICSDFFSIDLIYAPIEKQNIYSKNDIGLPNNWINRFGHSMILSEDKKYIYIFGGGHYNESNKLVLLNDIWRFELNNNQFINLTENISEKINIKLYDNTDIEIENFHLPNKKIFAKLGLINNKLIIKGGSILFNDTLIYDNNIHEFDWNSLTFKIKNLKFLQYKVRKFDINESEIFNQKSNSFINIFKNNENININKIYFNDNIKYINNLDTYNYNLINKQIYFNNYSYNYILFFNQNENQNIILYNSNFNTDGFYFGKNLSNTNLISSCKEIKFISTIVGVEESFFCNLNGNCIRNACSCLNNYTGTYCETKNCLNDCNLNNFKTYLDSLKIDECNNEEINQLQKKSHICLNTFPLKYCSCNTYGRFGGDNCSFFLCVNNCGINGRCNQKTKKCECNNNKFLGNDCTIMIINMI